jgi:hypothetical protein
LRFGQILTKTPLCQNCDSKAIFVMSMIVRLSIMAIFESFGNQGSDKGVLGVFAQNACWIYVFKQRIMYNWLRDWMNGLVKSGPPPRALRKALRVLRETLFFTQRRKRNPQRNLYISACSQIVLSISCSKYLTMF